MDISGDSAVLRATEAKFGARGRLTTNQKDTFGKAGGEFTFIPSAGERIAETGLPAGEPAHVLG